MGVGDIHSQNREGEDLALPLNTIPYRQLTLLGRGKQHFNYREENVYTNTPFNTEAQNKFYFIDYIYSNDSNSLDIINSYIQNQCIKTAF